MKKILTLSTLLILGTSCGSSDSDDTMETHDHGEHGATADTDMTMGELVASESSLAYGKISFAEEELMSGSDHTHTASVMFFDEEGSMINGVVVDEVHPWMQTMGHGSLEDQLNFHQHDEMGHHWMVMGLVFSMGGDAGEWILKVSFTYDGQSDEIHLPIAEVK